MSEAEEDYDIFVSSDAAECYEVFNSKQIDTERGFIFNAEFEGLEVKEDLDMIIKSLKWQKFCAHPSSYNT
jgi:hypothetical protein